MTDRTREELIKELADSVTAQVVQGMLDSVKCCITCQFWQEQGELCTNPVNCPQSPGRPPAKIIAYGCEQYKPGVPF